jgi:hypothetical protein
MAPEPDANFAPEFLPVMMHFALIIGSVVHLLVWSMERRGGRRSP